MFAYQLGSVFFSQARSLCHNYASCPTIVTDKVVPLLLPAELKLDHSARNEASLNSRFQTITRQYLHLVQVNSIELIKNSSMKSVDANSSGERYRDFCGKKISTFPRILRLFTIDRKCKICSREMKTKGTEVKKKFCNYDEKHKLCIFS